MSENTPPNAGRSGSDLASSSAAATDLPGATPASTSTSTSTVSPQTPLAPPGLTVDETSASAAARASTDGLESASAVEPVQTDRQTAQQADAAQARAAAAQETAAQELAAQTAQTAQLSGAPGTAGASASPGAPPPGFGAPPDFDTPRPPPPGAVAQTQPAYLRQNDSAWTVLGRTIAARARQLFDRAGQRITQRTLRIGVSARIFHPEPGARGLRGKTLQYLEESVAHWVMSRDVMVFMIPTVGHQGMLHPSNIRLRDYAKHLDGLLLQGGADVSPQTYAASDMRAEWPGDRVRDMYELELLYEFIESGKPVLGVCRGCQLINVAFGGTLYQDIATEVPTAGIHVNEFYDQHRHSVRFPDGSSLASMFPGHREAVVNSIHHQAVKTLGRDLNVEAVSSGDGLIEAVRYRRAPFVVGVQWHPEFHRAGGPELLDCTPILDTFLRAARETRF
jgi:gamma-glutamyl-gamma-aminobutyrate hydrolase PuuD